MSSCNIVRGRKLDNRNILRRLGDENLEVSRLISSPRLPRQLMDFSSRSVVVMTREKNSQALMLLSVVTFDDDVDASAMLNLSQASSRC